MDGERVGKTPGRFKVAACAARVVVKHPDLVEWSQKLSLVERQVTTLTPVLKRAAPARTLDKAPKPLLAVLTAVSGAGTKLTRQELQFLTEIARGSAHRTLGSWYRIMTGESQASLLKPHRKTLERCPGGCETETGQLIGANIVLSSRVSKALGKLRVTVRLYLTSPPRLLSAHDVIVDSKDELEAAIIEAAARAMSPLEGL